MIGLPSSLSGRVALATALTGALAALLAAVVAWKIATERIDQAEDARLSAACVIFLNDLDMRDAGTTLDAAIAGELLELAPASIRVAVYSGGAHLGGDRLEIPAHECAVSKTGELVQRACKKSRGSLTVVAATTRASGVSASFLVGASLSSLVAALAAAAIGLYAARWAIAPLQSLTRSLDSVRAEGPSAAALPDSGGVREVEVLHGALAALVQRLGDAMARARRFSADAAHELRTPLTILSGQLDLLVEKATPGTARADLLALQLRVRTLSRLVERLLILATSEQAPLATQDPVALEDVARQCLDALPEAERRRVDLQITAQGIVRGDESLLSVLVENAVDNALKFSNGAPVTIRLTETDLEVLLDVVDEGPGLPANERERAFDPFFRASSARAEHLSGHGIGLALVAQVSRQHGGSCSFVDTTRGAHLRVSLPAWRPVSEQSAVHERTDTRFSLGDR